MSNGNGLFDGIPPWVKALGVIGVPGVIALYAVFVMGAEIRSVRVEQVQASVTLARHTESLGNIQQRLEALEVNLWLICRNTAPPVERGECRRP